MQKQPATNDSAENDGMNHPPRMLDTQSCLRHIPPHVEARDKVILDGLRYSLEIADAAHRRLRETLWQISSGKDDDPVDEYVGAVADAWSIVDSLNRLQTLCKSRSPYLGGDFCTKYAESVSPVVKLRNAVQHLHARFDKLVADKEPVWGVLSWMICVGNPPSRFSLCAFAPGALRTGDVQMTDIPKRQFRQPVDAITLTADKTPISLSDLMLQTAEFAGTLDGELRSTFPVNGPSARDLYARVDGSFTGKDEPAPTVVFSIKHDVPTSPQERKLNRAERRKRRP